MEIEDNPNGPNYWILNDPQYPQKTYHYIAYQANSFMEVISLVKTVNDEFEILSISLSAKGCKNTLQVSSKCQWLNGYAGDVSTDFDGKEFCFIEPFFFKNRKKLKINKTTDISLFGVALSCELSQKEILEVSEGQFYEMLLEDFLVKNPDKTAADMEPVKLSTQGMTYFEEANFKAVYDYRGSILSVDQDEFFGEKCFKLTVLIYKTQDNNKFIAINLYASAHVLEGYVPSEGDDITGRLILFGSHFDKNSNVDVDIVKLM